MVPTTLVTAIVAEGGEEGGRERRGRCAPAWQRDSPRSDVELAQRDMQLSSTRRECGTAAGTSACTSCLGRRRQLDKWPKRPCCFNSVSVRAAPDACNHPPPPSRPAPVRDACRRNVAAPGVSCETAWEAPGICPEMPEQQPPLGGAWTAAAQVPAGGAGKCPRRQGCTSTPPVVLSRLSYLMLASHPSFL